jgi:DNA helicase-2/ATP-dependent DNA helicase PcrA
MSKIILDQLNPQQKEAITHTGGPILILAGAGSGKTRVITHRFAHLAKKTSPSKILAVTFTNKAAGEMKERISALIKKDLKNTWVGTFHSQCNRILRKEIAILGYKNNFSIFDSDDQSSLIRHILKEFKLYEALYKGIISRISGLKADFISPEDFLSNGEGFGFDEKLARVYVRYQDELKRCNALDYDDLIMLTVKLFEGHPEILKKYQDMFKYVLVDEFQDTNKSQYRLLKLITNEHRNICVVGDDDQSIYGFRGANVDNILSFEKDFPDVKVIKLEQNYRSTKNIINVSSSLIKENSRRREKTLQSNREEGEKVCHCWFASDLEEAKYISKQVREFYLKGQYNFSDFAVLYRINIQGKSIEDALRHENIPYRIIGGMSFYHRREIKDMTSYMRIAINRDDNVSLRRIINVPARGIGASTLGKIEQQAKKQGTSLYAAITDIIKNSTVTPSAKEKLQGFVKIIEDISSGENNDSGDMLRNIYAITGYSENIEDQRAENVLEFIKDADGKPLDKFMDSLSLVQNTDDVDDEENVVTLLTLHSAKGLEFPVVFISGLEEGVLPFFKAKTPHEVDEERRLLYVGMTRAKDYLWLTGANRRRMYAKTQEQEPSRFLKTLPASCCRVHEVISKPTAIEAARESARRVKVMNTSLPYAIGTRVKHPKWGVGVVRDSDGQGDAQKITVNFPDIGIKKLSPKFANLEQI